MKENIMKFLIWVSGFFMADKPQSSRRFIGIFVGMNYVIVCYLLLTHKVEVEEGIAKAILYSMSAFSAAALGFAMANIPGQIRKLTDKKEDTPTTPEAKNTNRKKAHL